MTTSPTHASIVTKFFKDYEKGTNTFEVAKVTKSYTNDFLAADPNGVYAGQNNAAFRKAIPERKKQFQAMGFEKSEIVSLTQKEISNDYVEAKVKWRMIFKKDGKPIVATFFITYIVFIKDGKAQIPFYISHESEEKVMKDLGLI